MKMSTYDEIIEEYNIEDDNWQAKTVYATFGLAVYRAQCLEEQLEVMLMHARIVGHKIDTDAQIREIIGVIQNSKNVLGEYVGEVQRVYGLPDSLADALRSTLTTRNYLIHHYFNANIQKCTSDQGRRGMLKYLTDFCERELQLEFELEPHFRRFTEAHGISEGRAEKELEHFIHDHSKT